MLRFSRTQTIPERSPHLRTLARNCQIQTQKFGVIPSSQQPPPTFAKGTSHADLKAFLNPLVAGLGHKK
jgi:hypothetical protein